MSFSKWFVILLSKNSYFVSSPFSCTNLFLSGLFFSQGKMEIIKEKFPSSFYKSKTSLSLCSRRNFPYIYQEQIPYTSTLNPVPSHVVLKDFSTIISPIFPWHLYVFPLLDTAYHFSACCMISH